MEVTGNREDGEKNYAEENVFLFFSMSEQLQDVFKDYKLLKSLTVIGQRVESLDGIEELVHLEELWVVEGGLQQEGVAAVSRCLGLQRLYLYDNELCETPDLTRLDKLTRLWLSGNQIHTLRNINNLLPVRELNLSSNNIALLDCISQKSTLKIESLNLSGNPISNIKEVEKLVGLRMLKWLILADPSHLCTPVTLLDNYRAHVVHCLPHLECLDLVPISSSERSNTETFYQTKLQYYRLTLHHELAKLWASRESALVSKCRELEMVWCALHSHGEENINSGGEKSSNLRFWEDEARRWKVRKELCMQHYDKLEEITKNVIQLELEHSGNIRFEDIDLAQNTLKTQFRKKFDSFFCHKIKDKIVEVELEKVWAVRGPHTITVLQDQFQDSWEDVYITSPVQDLSYLLFESVVKQMFGGEVEGEVTLSSCLADADPLLADAAFIHRQLLLRSHSILSARLLLLSATLATKSSDINPKNCHLLHHSPSDTVPLYLVLFRYVFQDYFQPLKVPPVTGSGEVMTSLLQNLVQETKSQHLTRLVLSRANLKQLDLPVMEHITAVDLSYNSLQDLSTIASIFPKLASLNLAFNKISSLESLQNTKHLTQLVLKWNFLSDFLNTLTSINKITSVKQIDLSWNPFRDVISSMHQLFLVCKHLNTLHSYNGHSLPRSLISGQVTLKFNDPFPMVPAWRGSQQPLTVKWRSELSKTNEDNHLGIIKNQIVSITLRDLKLTQFRSVLSLNKLKWVDLSENLISSPVTLKTLTSLEEVNLSHNVMDGFACPNERFKRLTKLNLSFNVISSLASFSCQAFPYLKLLDLSNNRIQSLAGLSAAKSLVELYLSHNRLQGCETLAHCKTWRAMKVLDLSFNPMAQSNAFRQTCLYYLPTLEYINGTKVDQGERKGAETLHGGTLDQEYLIRVYSKPTLCNLTHLYLTNCSIKGISLSNVSLVNVTSVTLDHNKISSLSWVRSFPGLVRLSLSHNRVSAYSEPQSPSVSQPHTALRSLILDHNQIRSLLPLRLDLFPNLTLLALNDNNISALSGLGSKPQLERLVLDRNKLSYISADQLATATNLLELYLERNSLSELNFLRPLKKLQKLFLGFNRLVSKSSLAPLGELVGLRELTVHGNPLFRRTPSYRDSIPKMPALRILEGHPLSKNS